MGGPLHLTFSVYLVSSFWEAGYIELMERNTLAMIGIVNWFVKWTIIGVVNTVIKK